MSTEPFEQELAEFKKLFYEATKRKDRATLETLIHDDFRFVDPEGQVVDKVHCLYSMTHPNSHFTDNFKREEKKISTSVDGDTVTEVATVDMVGTLKGLDRTGAYINTATYVKGPNGWQMLSNTLRPR
jgi:hypothetical protein